MARLMPALLMVMASTGSLLLFFYVSSVRSAVVGICTGPGSVSRIIALLLIITNLKVLPFVWHIRIFNALFQHFFLSSLNNPIASSGPAALFQPIVTSSRAPPLECDYNLHKSNSTFFADLDVTRIHLLARLFRTGIAKLRKTPHLVSGPDGVPAKGGNLMVVLGGTHCSFRREIKPFQAYEMWSRVLAWDRKWIYVVTHFVKPASAKSKKKTKPAILAENPTSDSSGLPPPQDRVLASAMSKYVIKLDRLTIPPETLLHASNLLPTATSSTPEKTIAQEHREAWDHARVEGERERGMMYARSFGALDGLHGVFEGAETGGLLGVYRDL